MNYVPKELTQFPQILQFRTTAKSDTINIWGTRCNMAVWWRRHSGSCGWICTLQQQGTVVGVLWCKVLSFSALILSLFIFDLNLLHVADCCHTCRKRVNVISLTFIASKFLPSIGVIELCHHYHAKCHQKLSLYKQQIHKK